MLTKLLTGELTFTSLSAPDLSRCTRNELRSYFTNSYDLNESLFTALKDESVFYKCPDRLRLPLIFYYGHTAAVFMNKLILSGLINRRINESLETIFETGVDEMSWDDTENYRMGGTFQWPSVEETVEYRRKVRAVILRIINTFPLDLPITIDSPWWALLMGIEHERIHIETSSVLIRQLPVDFVIKPDGWVYGPNKHGDPVIQNPMIKVGEQNISYGKQEDFPSFGWDNEYGHVNCRLAAFEASSYLVTNREFLQFVDDGGYETVEFWTSEGWQWVQYRQTNHPTFWICQNGCKGGCGGTLAEYSHCRSNPVLITHTQSDGVSIYNKYRYRAMFDEISMPWDWPVDVNYHEAKAFCAWKGPDFRLPAEAEHNAMRGVSKSSSVGVESDIVCEKKPRENINMTYGSSTPVNMYPANTNGFHDVFGNVWEWTEDHFNGLTEFRSSYLYDDYSTPCFDGRHNVILGGSWISTGGEASQFARYGFRRHFFQHAGFRVVRSMLSNDADKVKFPARIVNTTVFVLGSGVQESVRTLDESKLEVHNVATSNLQYAMDTEPLLWGITELEFGIRESFAVMAAKAAMENVCHYSTAIHSALHIGAGTGCTGFELSEHFDHVLAVDYSARLIDSALRLQRDGMFNYQRSNGQEAIATVGAHANRDRVVFKQFTWLPNEVGHHDLVLLTHLDRVQNHKAWLARVWEIVLPKGLVVIVAKASWNRAQIEPIVATRLKFLSESKVRYNAEDGQKYAIVTIWKRN